ncbi:MAG: threonylcarbamoyl-AMP synthase [Magnetococcales bacterium]|nr:threonylcarbamoyl-AMP synthase [Magnetococcales bacterium]
MKKFHLDEEMVGSVCQALRDGQVVAHPTETVYGFAVDPWQPAAIEKLLQLKGRAQEKGMLLLIPDRSFVPRLTAGIAPLASLFMDHFWPGPLTLLLPAQQHIPPEVTGGSGWLALRHSSSPVVQEIMNQWQSPLISTSANGSGDPPAQSAPEIHRRWGRQLAYIVPGEVAHNVTPSTIVKIDQQQVVLIRHGAVAWQTIESFLAALGVSCNKCGA